MEPAKHLLVWLLLTLGASAHLHFCFWCFSLLRFLLLLLFLASICLALILYPPHINSSTSSLTFLCCSFQAPSSFERLWLVARAQFTIHSCGRLQSNLNSCRTACHNFFILLLYLFSFYFDFMPTCDCHAYYYGTACCGILCWALMLQIKINTLSGACKTEKQNIFYSLLARGLKILLNVMYLNLFIWLYIKFTISLFHHI